MNKNPNIPDKQKSSNDMFITWSDDASFHDAQDKLAKAYSSIQPVVRSSASSSPTVRNGMDRYDYEIFRPGEAVPVRRDAILAACVGAYERVSPIKNIIDMMVDFTCQGIRLVHQHNQVQQFYRNWWDHIDGYGRSQHFANNLYLLGTVAVKKQMAKLGAKSIEDIQKGLAALSDDYDIIAPNKFKTPKNVIPYSYSFLNPATIELMGGELALFAGVDKYGIKLPPKLISLIKNPRSDYDKELVSKLPAYITEAVLRDDKIIPLDETRVKVYHYKKQDWQQWAYPILYSIMDDIFLLQKMKLTDAAALDGAISHIRIWKLGSLEHKLFPSEEGFQRVLEALENAGNGQSLDFVWGPDIDVKETTSDIHAYLGQDKYIPVLSSIYSGLGVPPTLVGGVGGDKGFTNNSLSLKTLIERLNYGRDHLSRFWNNEIKLVQQAMQFRFPAKVEFRHALLTDEASFNSLLIDLLDRDVISVERVREYLGYIPEIEEAIVKWEWKSRNNKKMPPKAGPYHDAEQDFSYKKIFTQLGVVTPTELGLELEPKKRGEKTPLDLKTEKALLAKPPTDNTNKNNDGTDKKGVQFEGRPKDSKDTTTRKTKRVAPRTNASENESKFINLSIWAKDAQQAISDIVHPIFLQQCNKKNMRSLTTEEVELVEHLKFKILCNIEPDTKITKNSIAKLMQEPLKDHITANQLWRSLVANYVKSRGSNPSVEDVRNIQNYVYALYKGDQNG